MAATKIQVGDAISVYWDGDRKWYAGEILEIDEKGNCHIQYEDGERERLNLGDVKYRAGKNWKGCLRDKKIKIAANPLRAIQEILFDVEDRLPPNGVFKNQMQWWNKWHSSVSEAVESGSIKEISKATLEIALQIKRTITTPWWSSNQAEWKKRTKTATTVLEMDLLVKELRSKVVDWTSARQLWEVQEQKACTSWSSNPVGRTDRKYVKELDHSAGSDAKALVDRRNRLQESRKKEVPVIQSDDNKRNNSTTKHEDDQNGEKQREFKSTNIETKQSRKRKMKDGSEKIQNGTNFLETDIQPENEAKEFCSKEEVKNIKNNNLNVINKFGLSSDEEMQQAKEILLMEEIVHNHQNDVLLEIQGEEEFDLGKVDDFHGSVEIETFVEKADDGNHLFGSENSKETSGSVKLEGKHLCSLTNSIQDKGQLTVPEESDSERHTFPKQKNCNVGTEQEYISVKMKEGTMVAGSHDIQALQQKTKVMDDSYIEVLCKQKCLRETHPELRRSPRLGLKAFLVQNPDRRISHKQSHHLEGKGHSGCLDGLKSDASENEVSIGSPACSRGGHQLRTIPVIRKRKRTCLTKNAHDKSTKRNRERWRFQLTNDSMTLRLIKMKNTFTTSTMKNGEENPKDTEISSTIEGMPLVSRLRDGSNVWGASSTTDPVEVVLDHSMLGYICNVCQSGGADNLLLLCDGKKCSCSVHTFCLQPPLLNVPEGDWLCPYCKDSASLNSKAVKKGGHLYPQKKIERILGRRQVQVDTETSGMQLQYLVKWISLSHHHDTWVPESWVLHHDRSRVLNFQRKFPLGGGSVSISVDERKPEWLKIDRVIACREKVVDCDSKCEIVKSKLSSSEKKGKYEFLVKWMGLDYSDATWEDSCNEELLITADKLVERHKKANERDEIHSGIPISASIKVQPSYLKGGILHDYQLQGMKWLLTNFEHRRNVILADEMGLGKTIQTIAFIVCMKTEQLSSKPVLVIAPKSTLSGWDQEFRRWASALNVILYQGDKESRSCIREHEFYTPNNRVLFDVLVTSYELAMIDSTVLQKLKWSSIIVDEGHRIKNFHSRLATLLKQQATDFRLLLTGTPLQNTLTELFALLHFLDPSEVPDPELAACAFSEIGTSSDQSDSEKTREHILRIHDLLQPRMLRRLKSEVLRNMIPGKRLMEVSCALTIPQRRLYVNLLKRNYKELNKSIHNGRKRSLNSLLVDLKMCCNHPYLFPGQEPSNISGEKAFKLLVEASGKLQLLEKLLPRLKEDGHRVLLFSQMTKMLDLLEDFLSFLGFSFYRIDGKTSASERQQMIKNFNSADSSVFIFLISTRAGGLGINLPTADTVIIYDPDFNPFVDLQAQSRAHRIGQEKAVIVYQLITKCSIEEKILQRSRRKLAMENLVMNPIKGETFKELHDILLHGAKNILDEQDIGATSIHYTNEDIEILLNREIKMGENGTSEENGYLGAIQGVPVQDEEAKPVVIVEEWEELLGPLIKDADKEEELGRGKRQRKEVRYACDPVSDDDEEYSPSSTSSSSDRSVSVGKCNNRKITDGEVTSAMEISSEQYENKPQIGYFAERESSLGSSILTHTFFSSNSACLSKSAHPVLETKFTGCGLREGNDRGLTQKMQSELSMIENRQDKIISCSDASKTGASKSTGYHMGQTINFHATKNFRVKEDNLVESQAHESLYANDLNTANRHALPILLRHSEPILHIVSRPPMVQVFDSGDKLTVQQKTHLLPGEAPSLSHISRVTVEDSHLRERLVSCPGINPLISQIDKRVDAILERVSQSLERNGNLNADEAGSSLTNTTASKNLSHFNQSSLSVPKLEQVMQTNHLSSHNKRENSLS